MVLNELGWTATRRPSSYYGRVHGGIDGRVQMATLANKVYTHVLTPTAQIT